MVYAYQIFGNYFKGLIEVRKISERHRHVFAMAPGLRCRYVFKDHGDEVFSALYFCEDYETALEMQKVMHGIMEQHEADVGFTTEFIFELIEKS
jgi:hypothetical protein